MNRSRTGWAAAAVLAAAMAVTTGCDPDEPAVPPVPPPAAPPPTPTAGIDDAGVRRTEGATGQASPAPSGPNASGATTPDESKVKSGAGVGLAPAAGG